MGPLRCAHPPRQWEPSQKRGDPTCPLLCAKGGGGCRATPKGTHHPPLPLFGPHPRSVEIEHNTPPAPHVPLTHASVAHEGGTRTGENGSSCENQSSLAGPLPHKHPQECPPSLHPFACPAPNPRVTRKVGGTEGKQHPSPIACEHNPVRRRACTTLARPTIWVPRAHCPACGMAFAGWLPNGEARKGHAHTTTCRVMLTPLSLQGVMCEWEAMQRECVAPIPLQREPMGGEGCLHAPPQRPSPLCKLGASAPHTSTSSMGCTTPHLGVPAEGSRVCVRVPIHLAETPLLSQ